MNTFTAGLIISALLLVGGNTWADSNKQKNNGNQGQQGQSQKKNNQDYSGHKPSGKKQKSYEQDYDEDYSDIRRIFEQNKGMSSGYQSLPPGISKNLQRGKPLPPGIAKKFNADIENQLPYYPGNVWRQVGSDAVLIDATTSVVREVMKDVLR